jgi:hypothetical protein
MEKNKNSIEQVVDKPLIEWLVKERKNNHYFFLVGEKSLCLLVSISAVDILKSLVFRFLCIFLLLSGPQIAWDSLLGVPECDVSWPTKALDHEQLLEWGAGQVLWSTSNSQGLGCSAEISWVGLGGCSNKWGWVEASPNTASGSRNTLTLSKPMFSPIQAN